MSVFEQDDIDAIGKMMTSVITGMTGPLSDLIRSTTFATVDALIDARGKMIMAGWPEDYANMMCVTIVNRNADVAKQIGEAISKVQASAK